MRLDLCSRFQLFPVLSFWALLLLQVRPDCTAECGKGNWWPALDQWATQVPLKHVDAIG